MNTNLAYSNQSKPFYETELLDSPSAFFRDLLVNIYPLHPQEPERLASLEKAGILDSPPEPGYDDLVWLASEICHCPMAAITVVAEDRQWFKAQVGLSRNETEREHSFCTHCILSDGLTEVANATKDDRFWENPLVTGKPNIRFYAGVPIGLPGHPPLGALCVMATRPRKLTTWQRKALKALAKQASALLELRVAEKVLAG